MLGEGRGHFACSWRDVELNELASLQWTEVRLNGADALTFAQGQFSQEISESPKKSLLLAPDGHVIAGGEIRSEGGDIVFVVPTVLAEVVRARLQRFVLRVDVSITLSDDISGPYGSALELFVAKWPSEFEWNLNLPPHSYGQWVVDAAVSFSKGCFTGQELVGRADARGATMPWRFSGGQCEQLNVIDSSLRQTGPEGPRGVTSWIRSGEHFLWRGIAHRTWENHEPGVNVEFMA